MSLTPILLLAIGGFAGLLADDVAIPTLIPFPGRGPEEVVAIAHGATRLTSTSDGVQLAAGRIEIRLGGPPGGPVTLIAGPMRIVAIEGCLLTEITEDGAYVAVVSGAARIERSDGGEDPAFLLQSRQGMQAIDGFGLTEIDQLEQRPVLTNPQLFQDQGRASGSPDLAWIDPPLPEPPPQAMAILIEPPPPMPSEPVAVLAPAKPLPPEPEPPVVEPPPSVIVDAEPSVVVAPTPPPVTTILQPPANVEPAATAKIPRSLPAWQRRGRR